MSNQTSLSDLSKIYHTQVTYDGVDLPLKIDIKDIKEDDYIRAISFMNEYKEKKIEVEIKEHNELDDIKLMKIADDKIMLSYEKLTYQSELDYIDQDKRIDYAISFINTEDKLFENNSKTILEFLQIDNIRSWLERTGMTDDFYNMLYMTVSQWIDIMITEFHANVKVALLLNDKDGKEMNHNLSKLKVCYDTMKIYYFSENSNKTCFEDLSYREQHLIQSYATKMNYIEIAINKETKKQFEENKNKSNNNKRSSSSRGNTTVTINI